MKVTIRLLDEWSTRDGSGKDVTYGAGEFLEVDQGLAKDLIDAGLAETKTKEEYEKELAEQLLEKQRRELKARQAEKRVNIRVIGQQEDPRGGFRGVGHFAYDVYKAGPNGANISDTLRKWTAKTVGSDEMRSDVSAAGGFLVPSEFRNTLLTKRMEKAVVRPRATPIPMGTNSISIPYVNETTRSTAGTTRGGIVIATQGETAQKTGSKPSLGLLNMNLKTLYGVCYVTNQLLEDSPVTLETLLPNMFAESLAFEEDYLYLWGTGAAQVLGVNNAPCLISVTAETGQAATTILYENIANMWSRLDPAGMGNAVWAANPNCFPQLTQLHIKVGTGGIPVWIPGNSAAGAPNGTIFGRPLILSEKCQSLGTVGDILLADFSQYYVGFKAGQDARVDTSIHLRFDYNETAFRIETRHDGQPSWSSALTPRFGSSISPFVVLATRS